MLKNYEDSIVANGVFEVKNGYDIERFVGKNQILYFKYFNIIKYANWVNKYALDTN